jgi:hypothetical protein
LAKLSARVHRGQDEHTWLLLNVSWSTSFSKVAGRTFLQ